MIKSYHITSMICSTCLTRNFYKLIFILVEFNICYLNNNKKDMMLHFPLHFSKPCSYLYIIFYLYIILYLYIIFYVYLIFYLSNIFHLYIILYRYIIFYRYINFIRTTYFISTSYFIVTSLYLYINQV